MEPALRAVQGQRAPGLFARITAHVLALCTAILLNWQTGRPPRELIAYRH